MTTQDSSVLFALDELRAHERQRVDEESEKTRQRAEVARRQAAVAAERRLEAKNNAEDLIRLREQLEQTAADRVALEQKLHRLEVVARKPPPPPHVPAPMHIVTQSKSHHLLWTATLLLSCLGVFVATYTSPEAQAPVQTQVANASDCPEPAPEPPTNRSANSEQAIDKAAPPKASPPEASPPEVSPPEVSASSTRSAHRGATSPKPPKTPAIIVDEDCSGPLCGLPK
tara:strand:+ start:56910 stop:57593 length:684 start_codon:yes stop_codon:yes gene_type:complete